MINFDPSIGAISRGSKVEQFSLVESLFSPKSIEIGPEIRKASGFEGAPSVANETMLDKQMDHAINSMNKVNLLSATWSAVFSIAQQIPETFKKLMAS